MTELKSIRAFAAAGLPAGKTGTFNPARRKTLKNACRAASKITCSTRNEHDAKAILPEPRSVKKQFPISFLRAVKIYTCAFFPFSADEPFFARDSGLLCMALRALGHDSKVIMPKFPEGQENNDPESVIRASMGELRDPQWWRSLGVESVAFICWGFKEHTPIISAAREGGAKTCAILDSNCNGFPYFDFFSTIRSTWRKGFLSEFLPRRTIGTAARMVVFFIRGLFSNYHAYVQVRTADVSAYNSPSALARSKRRARIFGGRDILPRMLLMGYPIPDVPHPLPLEQRKQKVVAVARWDAVRTKRPDLLMQVAERLVGRTNTVAFEIIGNLSDKMRIWHDRLPAKLKSRIVLAGVQPSKKVTEALGESMILYCTSAFEGMPLPVAEALCCGCTVVGLSTDDVPELAWAFHDGDGTPVHNDSIEEHVVALLGEIEMWQMGKRKPLESAKKWSLWFSANSYAKRLVSRVS